MKHGLYYSSVCNTNFVVNQVKLVVNSKMSSPAPARRHHAKEASSGDDAVGGG